MKRNDYDVAPQCVKWLLPAFLFTLSTSSMVYAQVQEAGLVRVIETKWWSPTSPDPMGIAYFPPSDGLLISDADVEEGSYFAGVNLWETTLGGSQVQEYSTLSFSDQPTVVAYNPDNGRPFFTDDSGVRRVYEMDPGPDGLYHTSDSDPSQIR